MTMQFLSKILAAFLIWIPMSASPAYTGETLYPYPEIGDGQPALSVPLTLVDGIVVDREGNVYISHRSKHRIRKIDRNGIITTVAGNGKAAFSGDGGPAIRASLNSPAGLTVDPKGNLYVADRNNHRIRKVDTEGIITTVAGNGKGDFTGDEVPAVETSLNLPSDVAVDEEGNLYISDRSNNRIRRVDPKGIITTVVGLGPAWYGGDFELALDAFLKFPFGIELDDKGNIFIADRGNNRVRKVNKDGIITTVAGDGLFASRGDRGPAFEANLAYPTDVAVDTKGSIYIADRNNSKIRKVSPLGIITTIMGTGNTHFNGDQGLAPQTNLHLPFALALGPDEKTLYVVDRNHFRIRRLDFATQRVETIAGNGEQFFKGDEGEGLGATLNGPSGLVRDSEGNLIFSDQMHNVIRKLTPEQQIVTLAGNGKIGNSGDQGSALKATLQKPSDLALDSSQNLYVVVRSGNGWRIRKIDREGTITWFAGDSRVGTGGDGGPAREASFYVIKDIAFDNHDNLLVADTANPFIRRITPEGIIDKVAAESWGKLEGDIHPNGIEIDDAGNIYVSDSGKSLIWKIDPEFAVTVFAGTGEFEDHSDGGPAVKAGIRSPGDLKFSPNGDLYVAEQTSHVIRRIDLNGIIHRVAGTGEAGFEGDGGPAVDAQINGPASMAFDEKGNLYFTDRLNSRLRKVDTNGIITTLAGKDHSGFLSDGLEVNLVVHNFP